MTYSYAVKRALTDIRLSECCRKSQLCGFLYALGQNKGKIRFSMMRGDIFGIAVNAIRSVLPDVGDVTEPFEGKFVFSASEEESDALRAAINFERNDFESCCAASFLRGSFIASGFIAEPTARFEASVAFPPSVGVDLPLRVSEKLGLAFHVSRRGKKSVMYMKKADDIGDFLSAVGLNNESFDYLNAGIEKTIVNTVNRQVNCESGNISKMISASKKQIDAIEYFVKREFDGLTPSLIAVAKVRLENPEISLSELAEMTDPPISKSGAAHRLNKIIALYEEQSVQ